MLSSVKEALNNLQQKFENARRQNWRESSRRSSSWQKWNSEELQSLLNIIRDKAEQLEGNLQLRFAGAQRFFAFDNNAVDKIPKRM
jgi:transposase